VLHEEAHELEACPSHEAPQLLSVVLVGGIQVGLGLTTLARDPGREVKLGIEDHSLPLCIHMTRQDGTWKVRRVRSCVVGLSGVSGIHCPNLASEVRIPKSPMVSSSENSRGMS